jgi:hypothetical protein
MELNTQLMKLKFMYQVSKFLFYILIKIGEHTIYGH